jgi:Protein of unknown function (DUF3024)
MDLIEGTRTRGADKEVTMKPKNPPSRRVRRGTVPVTDPPVSGGRAVILDFIQSQIEAFNDQHGGGVSVRKDARGYTLMREEDGIPVARLRPKGQGLFEVLYWNPYHERWRPVGSFGTVLALDQALEFIADDPLDCFWR